LVTSLLAAFLLGGQLAHASAKAFLPPRGEVFAGVAGEPISSYIQSVGKHPAVYEVFSAWGEYLPAMFADAQHARSRLMIHITTASGSREMITPAGIADGRGDGWLLALNRAMFDGGGVTYIRLMAEMDAYWNPYSAYGGNGRRRDSAHSTAAYRRAWKRVTLILRGGKLAVINAQLRRLGMSALHGGGDLPRPKVAMLWVPQVAGAPDVRGNEPGDYWPGRRWVDWIGTDFYGNAPNFAGLSALYRAYPGEPFVFGEYGLWGADDPRFLDRLFRWTAMHPRTRMLIYNQGVSRTAPFRLARYPRAAGELRRILASARFPAFAS
jgi:hypothetical protein